MSSPTLRSNKNDLALIVGAVVVAIVFSWLIPWATTLLWLAVGALLLWKAPAFVALIIVGWVGRNPDAAVFAVPSLLVLAGLQLAQTRNKVLGQREWLRVAGTAVLALLLSVVVVGVQPDDPAYRPIDTRASADTVDRYTLDQDEPLVRGSVVDTDIRVSIERAAALQDLVGGGVGAAELVPPLEESGTSWFMIVSILMALLLAAVGGWAWRGNRRSIIDVDADSDADVDEAETPRDVAASVDRLQRIGDRLNRTREPHEGLMTYASDLARVADDARIRLAGRLLSQAIYDGAYDSDDELEQLLLGLETDYLVDGV